MIAFMSSKKGTQAADKRWSVRNFAEDSLKIPLAFVPRYSREPLVRNILVGRKGVPHHRPVSTHIINVPPRTERSSGTELAQNFRLVDIDPKFSHPNGLQPCSKNIV